MFCVILVRMFVGPEKATSNTKDDLHKNLSNEKINPLILPVRNIDDTVTVFIDFSVQAIEDIDEKRQRYSVSGSLELSWKIKILVWNPRN